MGKSGQGETRKMPRRKRGRNRGGSTGREPPIPAITAVGVRIAVLFDRERYNVTLFPERNGIRPQDDGRPPAYNPQWFALNNRPIYFFGAGYYGYHAWAMAKDFRVDENIKGFLDSNPARTEYLGLPVYAPDYPLKNRQNPVIVVTVLPNGRTESEILEICRRIGYECMTFKEFVYAVSPNIAADLENNPEVIRCLDVWADDRSRTLYMDLIKARVSLHTDYLPVCEPSQYFLPIVPRKYYRSFLDCGAFDGDTLKSYLNYTAGDFDHYYAIEGSARPFAVLRRVTATDPRISIYPLLVSDKKKSLRFHDDVTAGFVSPAGTAYVEADTIDNLFGEKTVTMIKMDIEGCEERALAGGKKVITEQRPALAISMYHNNGVDMWKVPLWIHDLGLGYSLFCRHHSPALCETVCYAVPKEK